VDTPPVGDLPGLFRTVLMFEGPQEIIIRRSRTQNGQAPLNYELKKSELTEVLGDLEDTGSLVLLDKFLRSHEYDE